MLSHSFSWLCHARNCTCGYPSLITEHRAVLMAVLLALWWHMDKFVALEKAVLIGADV